MSVRLERRRLGWALVGSRLAPFGYVRNGRLRIKEGGDSIELTPDELEGLAAQLREIESVRPTAPSSRGVTTGLGDHGTM